jgi:hypothetical protein
MSQVTFQEIRAATHDACERGHLVWVRDKLAAILVEADEGWFLQAGLGPFEAEGLLFATTGAAEAWILGALPRGWLGLEP